MRGESQKYFHRSTLDGAGGVGTEKVPSISGVGSGVGWLFYLVRVDALRCAGCVSGNPVNTGDFRCAAFSCSTVRNPQDGLKGRCSTTELRP